MVSMHEKRTFFFIGYDIELFTLDDGSIECKTMSNWDHSEVLNPAMMSVPFDYCQK